MTPKFGKLKKLVNKKNLGLLAAMAFSGTMAVMEVLSDNSTSKRLDKLEEVAGLVKKDK